MSLATAQHLLSVDLDSSEVTAVPLAGLADPSAGSTNAQGDSPSSGRSPSVTPFGCPGAVAGLTTSATGQDRILRYSFRGAAANGSPVGYEYSTGGGWASLGTATSGTLTVPANGARYRLSVRAANAAGPGDTTTEPSAVAHGPFRMPAITATALEGRVRLTWSPTNLQAIGNGREVTATVDIKGFDKFNDGEYTTVQYQEPTTVPATVTVCATGTRDCRTSTASATTLPVPDPTARVGVGARYPGSTCTENGDPDADFTNCWCTTMAFTGMEPGPLQVSCTPRGAATSSRPGEVYTWP